MHAALLTNQMGYIIVIAQLPEIYGNVNRPYPRATPSDSGRFTAINPWPRALTITKIIVKHILEVGQGLGSPPSKFLSSPVVGQ